MALPGSRDEDKRRIRAAMRSRREQLGPVELWEASGPMTENLVGLLAGAARVGVFASIRGEASVEVERLQRAGIRLAWPVADPESRSLRFYLAETAPTRPGAFGIPEPDATDEVLPRDLDAVVVPGLAFGRQGGRLGYGGGFYDRFLPKLSVGALRVGVCYAWQVLDIVPVEPHDVPMTHVVTDSEIITTGR